jgi:uncharacterized protein (TIGR02611 family)
MAETRQPTESGASPQDLPTEGGPSPTPVREPPKLVRRLQERREAYKQRGRIYRTAWVIAGFIVFAAGAALLVLPGPAWLIIPIGLAMLSLEFAWAERLLDRALEGGIAVKEVAVQASRRQKILGGLAVVFGVAAAATLAVIVLL